MSPMKTCVLFLISLAFTEVASWTIDLPEVRKYLFEKSEKDHAKEEKLKDFNQPQLFFDNIKPDSPYNKPELDKKLQEKRDDFENDVYGGRYAGGYDDMSYMEKKVHGIVRNGTIYLEGLRRALEEYGELLKNCSRFNFTTQPAPNAQWLPQNEMPRIDQNTPISIMNGPFMSQGTLQNGSPQGNFQNGNTQGNFQNGNQGNFQNGNSPGNFQNGIPQGNFQNSIPSPTGGNQNGVPNQNGGTFFNGQNGFVNQTNFNQTFLFPSGLNNQLDRETCERATQASEHVRRLAELALWATRELQDRAYNDKYDRHDHGDHGHDYDHDHHHDDEEDEEMELLVRLAFFLDRLAYYTGYEPDARSYITSEAPPRTTRPTLAPPSPMGEVPDDVKMAMMNCLQPNSSQPAPERCRYPLGYPDFMRDMFNITDPPERIRPITTEPNAPRDASLREIVRNPGGFMPRAPRTKRDILTAVKALDNTLTALKRQKRDVNDMADVKNSQNVENPLVHVMKYYVKHKVWETSNPDTNRKDSGEIDVDNHLTAVRDRKVKRSIDFKKNIHLRIPENPYQDISSYLKHKRGVNYIKDQDQSQKIKDYLQKIRHSDRKTAKYYVQKIEKNLRSIKRRSIKYEDKFLPSRSQSPRQDISYYLKNMEGVAYDNNLAQAAAVRAGLEQHYQTGNIEVVRRFGSNYNPAVPFPLGFGIMRSFFTDL